MATVITPEELFFGSPTSLTLDAVEVGATTDAPKISIGVTKYVPEFQNAKGPIVGTVFITKVEPSCQFTVNQFSASKLAWTMPGSTSSGDQITWTPGRVPTASYKDLQLTGQGLDTRAMIFTLWDALSAEPMEMEFSGQAISGMKVNMAGHYQAATPNKAPFVLELDLGS